MDQYTTTRTESYFSKITNAFAGIIFGVLFFIAGVYLLFYNEGRIDPSKIAATAAIIHPNQPAQTGLSGKLVSVTGTVTLTEDIGDTYLKPARYIALKRISEIYAWQEMRSEKRTKNWGGSDTVEETFSYRTDWTTHPVDSTQFKYPQEHNNPPLVIPSSITYAREFAIGNYTASPSTINLPEGQKIQISKDMVINTPEKFSIELNTYLYIPTTSTSSFAKPSVGDQRISYLALIPGFEGTLFGALHDTQITTFIGPRNTPIAYLRHGDRATALHTIHQEHQATVWIARLIGFILIWLGLLLILKPITVFLDIIPIAGSIAGSLLTFITGLIAIVLSLAVIVISNIVHNLWLMLGICAVILFFLIKTLRVLVTRKIERKE